MPKVDGKGVSMPPEVTPQKTVEGTAPSVDKSGGPAKLIGPNAPGKK